ADFVCVSQGAWMVSGCPPEPVLSLSKGGHDGTESPEVSFPRKRESSLWQKHLQLVLAAAHTAICPLFALPVSTPSPLATRPPAPGRRSARHLAHLGGPARGRGGRHANCFLTGPRPSAGRGREGRRQGGSLVHMRKSAPYTLRSLSRRQFLKASGMAALFAHLPAGWAGRGFASDAPEAPQLRVGIIALTDCSSIVVAYEKGFFKEQGLDVTVSKEASWAVIRDKLQLGENQATHMLYGMPYASTMGLFGAPVKPMITPWAINCNGQAITLNNELKDK